MSYMKSGSTIEGGNMHKFSMQRLALLGILILCSALLMVNITQPWVGLDANSGVKRSIEAKNYLRYGFLNLKFGQANTYHQVSDLKDLTYYMHHPPLTSISIAVSFYLFGVSEFSYRLILILFTLCSVLLVYTIARRSYGVRTALLAAFIFSVMPVTTFYGRSNFEPLTQMLLLLSVMLYLRWFDDRRPGKFYLFLAIYAISLLTDWPVYFLGLLIPLHFFLAEKKNFFRQPKIILVPLTTIAGFALFLYYCYLVQPQAIQDFLLQLKIYLGAVRDPELLSRLRQSSAHGGELIDFTAIQFTRVLFNNFLLFFLYPVLVLSAFGFCRLIINAFTGKDRDLATWILLALPVIYCTLFYRSIFIHSIWLFYFAPPLALLAAVAIDGIFGRDALKDGTPMPGRMAWPYLFCIVLIFLPAVYNLKEMHGMQRKVLPGDQLETTGLIPGIAKQLKTLTAPEDVILTNLNLAHQGLRGGPVIQYYSERRIAGDTEDVDKLKNALSSVKGRRAWFYLWTGGEPDKNHGELEKYLVQNFPYTSHTVEKHKFKLFRMI